MQDSNIHLSIDKMICAQMIMYYYDCCNDACALLTSCLVIIITMYILVTEYCVMATELHDFQFSIACTAQSKTCGGYDHIGKPFI